MSVLGELEQKLSFVTPVSDLPRERRSIFNWGVPNVSRNVMSFRPRHVRLLNIALFAPENAIIGPISAHFSIALHVILFS